MTALGNGVLLSSLLASEVAGTQEAIQKLETEMTEIQDELSRALVIRRHVARTPERFAAHEREDVFERAERLVARRGEISTWLTAARERLTLLEQLGGSLAAEQERLAVEAAQARAAVEEVKAEARAYVAHTQAQAQRAVAEAERRTQTLPALGPLPGALPALEIHQAVEAERLRIARDLHDGPAQVLSNLVLEAEILERLLKRDPELVAAELQEFRNSVKNAVADIRRFMFDLRPDSLDDLGLIATLHRLTTEWQQRTGVTCRFNIVGEERRLPSALEEALFRIIQEALNNVRRHAQARTAEVNLEIRPDRVGLRVHDDGAGFDPAEPPVGSRRQLGVVGMRERAAAVGGRLDITSQKGAGTEITGDFPVQPA